MIPIAKPSLGKAEQEAAAMVIASGWVTQGPKVLEFEQAVADYVKAPYAVAVSNCTCALHAALMALDVGKGDEVITVSHSYVATANVIFHTGAEPVFVDVRESDFNMDPGLIEAAITPLTRAILCVHQMGTPCDVLAIQKIAQDNNLALIEDAACAIGAEYWDGSGWRHVGDPVGNIVCFSFHPRKVITTGEGGMCTTKSPELDQRLRLLRQHGMDLNDLKRHQSTKVLFEDHVLVGYNFRMSDINAAVGVEQLKRLDEIVMHRRTLADLYRELLAPCRFVTLPADDAIRRSTWQSFCMTLHDDSPIQRDALMEKLLSEGIATRRGVMNAHEQSAYQGRSNRFPLFVSERLNRQSIILPMPNEMSLDQVHTVATKIKEAIG